jgi:hypothetical protein
MKKYNGNNVKIGPTKPVIILLTVSREAEKYLAMW